jgi:hypothetical protein
MKKKEFSDSKVFVMTRPNDGENYLSITTEDYAKKEDQLDELYHIAFFDYLLNLSNHLKISQHKLLLTMSTAPLAYQFFLANDLKAQQVIQKSIEELKKQKVNTDFLMKLPDEVSVLDYIIRHNLSVFLNDVKKNGLEKALKNHQGFYIDLEQLFFSLPACFCFSLVDAANHLKTNNKKPSSRNKK